MSEVGEQEKIDIIVWDENPVTYIENALSPTKVSRVLVDKATNKATVYVMDDQLSIAIGKGGQNVRLASKLTGFDIDIEAEGETKRERKAPETVDSVQKPKLKRKSDLENSLLEAVEQHGE